MERLVDRKSVRELVKQFHLERERFDGNVHQLLLDQEDRVTEFKSSMTDDEVIAFSKVYIEEIEALTHEINLEIENNQDLLKITAEAEAHYNRAGQVHSECSILCSAIVDSVYRPNNVLEKALNGIEFIDAALKISPQNPKYLNVKALLYADGLGKSELGISILENAAQISPNDIQIQENIIALKKRIKIQESNAVVSNRLLQLFLGCVFLFFLFSFLSIPQGIISAYNWFIFDIKQFLFPNGV